MARKDALPPEIARAAEEAGVGEYREPPPRTPRAALNMVEEDPILAIDDSKIAAGGILPTPSSVSVPSDPNANTANANTDPVARLALAIEQMARNGASASEVPAPVMERLLLVMEKVLAGQERSMISAAEAIRKSTDPSNPVAPNQSDFNPRGERDFPRPRLSCRMYIPWEAEWECHTREEIELLNLLEAGEFQIRRNDESQCTITIRTSNNLNGRVDRLLMNAETALNNDHHYLMPPLRSILRQILKQRPHTRIAANAVLTKEDEVEFVANNPPEKWGEFGKPQKQVA